ncbi:hypothetical protein TNCT_580861, partial [Trichonephila clavata]
MGTIHLNSGIPQRRRNIWNAVVVNIDFNSPFLPNNEQHGEVNQVAGSVCLIYKDRDIPNSDDPERMFDSFKSFVRNEMCLQENKNVDSNVELAEEINKLVASEERTEDKNVVSNVALAEENKTLVASEERTEDVSKLGSNEERTEVLVANEERTEDEILVANEERTEDGKLGSNEERTEVKNVDSNVELAEEINKLVASEERTEDKNVVSNVALAEENKKVDSNVELAAEN